MFNLEEETLTHMGQSLADINEFDEAGLSDSDGMIIVLIQIK